MLRYVCLLSLCVTALGQIEEDMSRRESQLYRKMASSVAAPCCSNATPVLYHESAMAFDIREKIASWVKDGQRERDIMASLAELRYGRNQDALTFTIPERNSLGVLAWASPFVVIGLGVILFFFLQVRSKGPVKELVSDQELIDRYRPLIMSQLDQDS